MNIFEYEESVIQDYKEKILFPLLREWIANIEDDYEDYRDNFRQARNELRNLLSSLGGKE